MQPLARPSGRRTRAARGRCGPGPRFASVPSTSSGSPRSRASEISRRALRAPLRERARRARAGCRASGPAPAAPRLRVGGSLAEPAVDGGRALPPRSSAPIAAGSGSYRTRTSASACSAVVPVDGRDGRHLLAHVAHQPLLAEQLDRRARRPGAREPGRGRRRSRARAAWGERRMTPSSWPSWRTSAAYTAAPVTFSRASTRGPPGSPESKRAGAGVADRGEDSHVGAAAAQVPGQRLRDLLARGLVGAALPAPAVVEGDRLDHEPRRAVAALQRVVGDERPLHRMQVRPEALDGRERTALERGRRQQAARDRHAVEQHGAGAADALAADELGPGQAEPVAQDLDRGLLRRAPRSRATRR